MSENLHKHRSSMRTKGIGVSAAEKYMFKLNALKKENGFLKQFEIQRSTKE